MKNDKVFKEDKRLIAQKMFELLRETRAFNDIDSLHYEKIGDCMCNEYIYLEYKDKNKNPKRVNVSGDSGVAMIIDVLKRTGYLNQDADVL